MSGCEYKVIPILSNPGKIADHNMELFIEKGKLCGAFGNISWESHCWNITSSQVKDRGHKQREYNLWFTQHGIKIPKKIGQPLSEKFENFVKALIKLRHESGNQTGGNHMVVINAMRYLYEELEHENYNPILLNTDHFYMAESKAKQELSPRTARQIGVYLTAVAKTLNANQLTKLRIHFQTSLPTHESGDRLSDTAKSRRERLLPRKEVLQALAEISQKLNSDEDKIRMSIIKILIFTGFRMGEALTLPLDTLVFERASDTTADINTRIGLRYWPEKGAESRIKWLPTDAGKLVQEAIETLITHTNGARAIAKWLEQNPDRLKSRIDRSKLLDMKQVADFVGVKEGVFYCKRRNVPIVEKAHSGGGHKKWYVKFEHLEQAILQQRWDRPMLRLPNGKVQLLSESLCVVFFEQLHSYHAYIKWLVRPISETNISNFICGAKYIKNVFEKYGHFDDQNNPLKIRSHSFRHLLNTLANEGGLSDVELAWWFGRKNIRDNQSYDHRTAEQLTEKARKMLLSGEMLGPIADATRQLPQIEAGEFVKTHVNAVHYTPYGICLHDFAQNPCEKHLNCLANCKEYHRTVGNKEERKNLTHLKEQTNAALEHAKNEMQEKTWGANTWINYHQKILNNIDKALAVDNHMFDLDGLNEISK